MNYKVLKNGELLRVHSCKVYPKPYNSTEHMEYVMFNVDDREEIVIESETEIKSAVIRPLSAGISFEISFGKIILSVDRPVKLSVEISIEKRPPVIINFQSFIVFCGCLA